MTPAELETLTTRLLAAFGTAQQLSRPSDEIQGFSLDDGYAVAHRMRDLRVARGEAVMGRKIGGTNPAMYHLTGATGPVWNFMYATTVHELPGGSGSFALGNFLQPRIEPELALHIARPPQPGMSEAELLDCIDRVSHCFELVHSPYSDWKVRGPDASAAYGLHQALLVGPWHDISTDRPAWAETLKTFAVTLIGSNGEERHGVGANALGSPVLALAAIVDDMRLHPDWTPVGAGEIVTTGTLTELLPVRPGDRWRTRISGAPLDGLDVTFI